ncbi:MAG: MerR family transcriptional regulator [Polyangiaceae bacterium]|nr:MerR family transcriptional regulator [Polyangiaceae bacterium]
MSGIDDVTLERIEREHPRGLTSAEILAFFAAHQIALSEATLRKYVQLGLLPRSVRVGRKGKHQGSQGLYPASVVRQILRIKEMMAESYTIEQIQREFFFMQGDLRELERTLASVFAKLAGILRERSPEGYTKLLARQVSEARSMSQDLLALLGAIETRLTARARVERAAAS